MTGVRRSTEIARIANRHGLASGFGLAMGQEITLEDATEYGIRLREALQDAGGIFVNLGQRLATRPDIIPPQTADELDLLNQDVEPAPRSEVEPELTAAFGESVDQVFSEFDWSPIGTGSLGQVYRATLVAILLPSFAEPLITSTGSPVRSNRAISPSVFACSQMRTTFASCLASSTAPFSHS